MQQTFRPVNHAVVNAMESCLVSPAEETQGWAGRALQELRAAPGSGWIPGTPNSIWPSLSLSPFLENR